MGGRVVFVVGVLFVCFLLGFLFGWFCVFCVVVSRSFPSIAPSHKSCEAPLLSQ